MPFKLGNLSGDKIFLGNTEVTSAFLGTQQVYSSGPSGFIIGTVTSDNLSANLGNYTYSTTGGLYLTSNGSKLFATTSGAYTSVVREYNLSTPYNISTISLVNTFDPPEFGTDGQNATFNNNGNSLYIVGGGNVRQYSLSTPFSLSSVSYVRQRSLSADAVVTGSTYDMQFNNDGTKMFVLSATSNDNKLVEYNLSTAYNIGTASVSTSFNLTYTGFLYGTRFKFNNDGSKVFVFQGTVIQQYNLSTPYSLSTASQDSNNYNYGSQYGGAFAFSSDGTKLYIGSGGQNPLVSQYTNTF